MHSITLIIVLSATICSVLGQTCPGTVAPALSAAQLSAVNRARTLGYVPTDAQVSSAANVQRIQRVLPQDKFDYLFPLANMGAGPSFAPYNYQNFLKAAAMFPDLCNSAYGTADLDKACQLELATMFAMFGQETGAHNPSSVYPQWRQALYYYNELNCPPPPNSSACMYCQAGDANYPCVAGQYYFGRGPFQLSWNYNYGLFSYVILGDAKILLNNPNQVTSGTMSWLAFASALWFYMTPQSPKPSMHDVATGYWIPNAADKAAGRNQGFGAQIMIINGGLECGGPTELDHAKNRIDYFQNLASYFGISAGSNLGCANMKQFDSTGSAATAQYWERSWSTNCACQLVSYQTPNSLYYNANVQTTYQRCLELNFPNQGGNTSPTNPTNPTSPGNPVTTAAPTPTTDCTKLKPCSNDCASCKAVASCTNQYVTDEHCGPCAKGQTWWPCNMNPGACFCFS